MFNKLKNKIGLIAIIAPVYAALDITPQGEDFSSLKDVSINSVLSGAISLALILVVVVFFFILILGAIKWITSSGDEKKVGEARSQITNALIGLAIVFAAWAVLSLISTLFKVEILKGFSLPSFTESTNSGIGSGSGSSGLLQKTTH
jgi:hypothetical protein